MALRILKVTGKSLLPEKAIQGLDQLPSEILADIDTINQSCGVICVFAYLRHATTASFSDVKAYVDSRGWHHSAD